MRASGYAYYVYADVSVIHCTLSLFLALNLLICYWEACLFLRRSDVETRTAYWRERRRETGRTPALEFFAAEVPWTGVLSPTVWTDVWATYSQYDPSFADRRTFGFNADTANGFVTAAPTLLLYAAVTVDFMPPLLTGMLGLALFWQWTYVTSVYLASFFIAGRHESISRREMWVVRPWDQRPVGALPAAGPVRLRPPDPRRELQRRRAVARDTAPQSTTLAAPPDRAFLKRHPYIMRP